MIWKRYTHKHTYRHTLVCKSFFENHIAVNVFSYNYIHIPQSHQMELKYFMPSSIAHEILHSHSLHCIWICTSLWFIQLSVLIYSWFGLWIASDSLNNFKVWKSKKKIQLKIHTNVIKLISCVWFKQNASGFFGFFFLLKRNHFKIVFDIWSWKTDKCLRHQWNQLNRSWNCILNPLSFYFRCCSN